MKPGGGGSPQRFFRGQVDELALYNRALTTNEIAAIYAAGASKIAPPSLAMSLASGSVLLSWPASAVAYGLISSTNLIAGTWETVTNMPVVNGLRKEVSLPVATPAQRFFRLVR